MKRSIQTRSTDSFQPLADVPTEVSEHVASVAPLEDDDHTFDFDDDADDDAVFYNDGGSIFGGTSLIDDALLREAIGGRFRS